jgi:hypothetical protein
MAFAEQSHARGVEAGRVLNRESMIAAP